MATLLAAGLLGGAGYWFVWKEGRGDAPPPLPLLATAEIRVVALGELLPQSDVLTIAAPTGQEVGRIAEIKIREGEFVTKETVLAVLDTLPARSAQTKQQRAVVEQKRAALYKLSADLAAEKAKLEAQLAQQIAVRDKLAAQIARQEKLKQSGVSDAASLADKRLDLASAEASVRSSEVSIDRNAARDESGLLIDEVSATADLAASAAALMKAEADEAKSYILAPIDGRILKLHGKLGEQIGTSGFAEIGNTATMLVRCEVFEADIGLLRVGMAATVTSRSLDGQMQATIERIGARISPQSITSTDPAATVDARIVEVWLRLDENASRKTENFSGLQVQATFTLEKTPNA